MGGKSVLEVTRAKICGNDIQNSEVRLQTIDVNGTATLLVSILYGMDLSFYTPSYSKLSLNLRFFSTTIEPLSIDLRAQQHMKSL